MVCHLSFPSFVAALAGAVPPQLVGHAGGLLDYNAVNGMLDTDAIGALGLDVQWQEPWDPQHYITNHPK